jgi:hypothetical protein
MPTFQEIRQQYPQYSDLSDQQLVDGLHRKYYSDLSSEEFARRIGYQTAPVLTAPPKTDWLRKIALGGRAAGEGVFNTLAMADEMINQTSLKNSIGSIFGLQPQPTKAEEFSALLDRFGAYRPQTDSEKLLYEATKGSAGALTGAGPAGIVKNAAAAGAVTASGALGGSASELVRQEGGGAVAQTVAGIAGALVPGGTRSAAGALGKRLVRGGEEGRARAAENIRAFEAAGAQPSMGQAAQSRRMQAAESLLSKTPGGAGVMARRAQMQADGLGAGIERQASKLSPHSSAEQAGRKIQRGISGEGGFVEKFKGKQEEFYDELDRYIPSKTLVDVSRTAKALATLNEDIPGAPNVSKFFKNAKIQGIEGALKADELLNDGRLPYEALKKLRTLVGREMAESGLMSDVPRSKWKALYGALSSDLEVAATQAGPRASAAYARANNYTRAGMRRLEVLDSVIDKNGGPEAVFRAATSGTKEGATTLRAVMQSLPKDGQQMVTATVLRRLGRAKAGYQDDLGETFSTETFLTNWNSMAPEAKAVLFNRYGHSFRQDMDTVAKVAANLRQGSQVFRNPSGTGQAVTQATTAATFIMSLITGNLGTAGGIAAGVGGANLSARLFTNPQAVRWLATKTRAPVSAIPALIAQLNRSDDPDLQELGQKLEQAVNQTDYQRDRQ